jgi:hypothetical protein
LKFDIRQIVAEIESSYDLWDAYKLRTAVYEHSDVSDIWVRYNAWENYTGDRTAFNEPHESSWYPAIEQLPSVKSLVFDLMRSVEGERLGGVLITRIPAHGECRPHRDGGWHASYYRKFAIQLASAPGQAFCFEGESLSAKPGETYSFSNEFTHWVTNPTEQARMTLIVCIKTERFPCPGA